MIYYVAVKGLCGLMEARSVAQARREALLDFGRMAGEVTARKATGEDVRWIADSGGYVPDAALTAEEWDSIHRLARK